ncbi:MAG TPA: cytochrome c oxidase subunit II [Gammaproteobacteria bacterium]|nr:cytochrome c oxidase subunit II [Gammaproteobacteria bacterium]
MCFTKLKAALRWLTAFALSAASSSALADYTLNMPKGATDISGEVYGLHMLLFWVCVGIGIVVFSAMIVSIILHRRSRNPEPAKWHHNTTVEVIWTTIPFIILIVVAIPAARTLIKMEDFRQSDISIKVTGIQWKWKYDYLLHDENGQERGFGFYSTLDAESNRIRQTRSGLDPWSKENYLLEVDNPLVVPVGKKVRLLLTAADVIHAWWVPEFAVKKDAIPGYINEIWFRVTKPGIYRGQCAELCGRDHAFMPIVVHAVPEEEYEAWVREQQEKAGVLASADGEAAAAEPQEWNMEYAMRQGEKVYTQMCASCHMATGEGLAAAGYPALKGSAIATGDLAAHLDIVLHGKPNTAMMAFGGLMSDEDIAAVVTYERNAWGNDTGDLVEPSDIAAAR